MKKQIIRTLIPMLMAFSVNVLFLPMNLDADCTSAGCEFSFHYADFNPSGPLKNGEEPRYPNDYAKTFGMDAPWRVSSLDDPIPFYIQIEGTDVDAINEMHCIAIYDVSTGAVPPEPEEDFWNDYEYTPDSAAQVYKAECGGCELYRSETGMYWLVADTFLNDGSMGGTMADGTSLTARNMGYTEADLGTCITFTVRLIYEESLNWTDIEDQDLKVYLGRAPLPVLPDWYLGDPHTHTWSTYDFTEIGASGVAMFNAMKTTGLHWENVTDHGFNLTDSKWQTVLNDCAAGTVPGEFIALAGEECDDGYKLDDAHHFLAFGLTDWIETYNAEPPIPDTLAEITLQGGFSYGAHTTDDSWSWTDTLILDALSFECFRGIQDFNIRAPYSSEDIYHPWGSSPQTGNWETVNSTWDTDFQEGLQRLDRILSQIINTPRYEFFFMGGSDGHGSMNYHIDWDVLKRDLLYVVNSNALGKVRTAAYCPDGLETENVLNSVYDGRTVVTDGPFIVAGISLDGVAVEYADCEAGIGDTLSVPVDDGSARLFLQWVSSGDYGPIRMIRVLRGDDTTGSTPDIVRQFTPVDGMTGVDLSTLFSEFEEPGYDDDDPNPDYYIRVMAFTYDPDLGPDAPGDVTIPGYDPAANAYQYRAVTNPIWINVTPPCRHTGDVTGDITVTAGDAQLAFNIALETYTPTYDEACAADCNGDGSITAGDAQQIFLTALEMGTCEDPLL